MRARWMGWSAARARAKPDGEQWDPPASRASVVKSAAMQYRVDGGDIIPCLVVGRFAGSPALPRARRLRLPFVGFKREFFFTNRTAGTSTDTVFGNIVLRFERRYSQQL